MTRGELFPVACGVASKNLGTTALLDLLVEGVPSPEEGSPIEVDGAGTAAFVFKTLADPFAGRITVFRVLNGTVKADSSLTNARAHAKERMGQLLELQGKEHKPATSSARVTSAPSRSSRTRRPATCCSTPTRRPSCRTSTSPSR